MQIIKFIGAGVFALLALRTGFKTLRYILILPSGSANVMTYSGLLGGFAIVIL